MLFACQLWAGISPFSHVRVASYDQTGKPNEDIIDLSICIERKAIDDNPSDPNAREKYENIIKVWADAIYEMNHHQYLFLRGQLVFGFMVLIEEML